MKTTRLNRLLAVVLAMVLTFNMVASALAVELQVDMAGYQDAVQDLASQTTDDVITETVNGYDITVSGQLPAQASLKVRQLDEDEVRAVESMLFGVDDVELPDTLRSYAFDISVLSGNYEWQPDVPVQVMIEGLGVDEDDLVGVVHIPDAAPATATYSLKNRSTSDSSAYEVLEPQYGNDSVAFSTNGFSIFYTIVDENGDTVASNQTSTGTITLEVGQTVTLTSDTVRPSIWNGGIWGGIVGLLLSWAGFTGDPGWYYPNDSDLFECHEERNALVVTAKASGTITVRYGIPHNSNETRFWGDTTNIICLAPSKVEFAANYPENTLDPVENVEQDTGKGGVFTFPTLDFPEIEDEAVQFDTPEGYVFLGWSLDADGTGVSYAPGIQGQVSSSGVVYYAQWFNPSVNNNVDAYFRIRLDGSIPSEPIEYTPEGYTTEHAITGKLKQAISIYNNLEMVDENIVDDSEPQVLDFIQANVGIPSDITAANAHQYRIEWYVVKHVSEALSHTGADWHVDGVLLESGKHLVIFDPNGGAGGPEAKPYGLDETVVINFDTIPVRPGYIFQGWADNATDSIAKYTSNGLQSFAMSEYLASDVSEDANVTLYAVWKPSDVVPYTVNHYGQIKDDSGSTWIVLKSETLVGTQDTAVTAEYEDFFGYAKYVDDSVTPSPTKTSGTVSETEPLVLNLYYVEVKGDLKINKILETEDTLENPETFSFQIYLFSEWKTSVDDSVGLTDTYDYYINGTKKEKIGHKGVITLSSSELKDDPEILIDELPAGTLYIVNEVLTDTQQANGFSLKAVERTYGALPEGEITATITNSYVKPTANLTISKSVTKTDSAAAAPADATFKFTVALTDANDVALTDTYNYDGSRKGTITNGGEITLAADERVTIYDLPVGTQYSVTESDAPYFTASQKTINGEITAADATAAFTNTYYKLPVGALKLTKVVKQSDFTGGSFTMNVKLNTTDAVAVEQFGDWAKVNGYTVTNNSVDVVVDVASTDASFTNSKTLSGLPVASYVVTETAPTTGYTVKYGDDANATSATVNVTASSDPVEVTVTNTATGNYETVNVSKTWVDDENRLGYRAAKVTITLNAANANQSFTHGQETLELSAANNWAGSWTSVPMYDSDGNKVTYTVTEADVQYYVPAYTGDVATGFVVTNTLQLGTLKIQKDVNGDLVDANDTFVFQVGGPGITGNLVVTIKGEGSIVINDLVPGTYTVVELTPWSARYTCGTATVNPVVENGEQAVCSFTNTPKTNQQWLSDSAYAENRFGQN